jgi:hypothetical protein
MAAAPVAHLTLDIPELQVMRHEPADAHGLLYHHRILFYPMGAGRWIAGTADYEIFAEDYAGIEIRALSRNTAFPADIWAESYIIDKDDPDLDLASMRAEAKVLARIMGVDIAAVAAAAGPGVLTGRWLIADVDSDRFGEEIAEDELVEPTCNAHLHVGTVEKRLHAVGGSIFCLEKVKDEAKWKELKRPGLPGGHAGDLRLLGNQVNSLKKRHLPLSRAVELMTVAKFDDWPHRGPKSVAEFLSNVLEAGGDLQVYHANFMKKSGLAENSAVSHEYRNLILLLRLGITYDQYDPGNSASLEQCVRRLLEIQVAVRRNPRHPMFDTFDHTTTGTIDEVGAARAPGYGEWMAEQQRSEAKMLKNTREWREETTSERRRQNQDGGALKDDAKEAWKKKKKGKGGGSDSGAGAAGAAEP